MDTQPKASASAQEFVSAFGGRLVGDPGQRVHQFASLTRAGPGEASFFSNLRLKDQLRVSQASLLILQDAQVAQSAGLSCTCIETADPYLYFAQAAGMLVARQRQATVSETAVHPSASVDPSATIGRRVRIAANVVVGPDCVIGDDCDVGVGCVLGAGVAIGSGSVLHPCVMVYDECLIGDRALLHSGSVIGADGFGFALQSDRSWLKIPQLGRVRIGHDVEIGANTTIDRGTLDDTVIGNGVKLDNQIQVAHNVSIGDHTAIAACVGIAGSASIGAYCQIGGAAGILGHLRIAEGTVIGPMSLVTSSIEVAAKYVGAYPLQAQGDWEKSAAIIRRLPELRRQVQKKSG